MGRRGERETGRGFTLLYYKGLFLAGFGIIIDDKLLPKYFGKMSIDLQQYSNISCYAFNLVLKADGETGGEGDGEKNIDFIPNL